MLTILFQAVEEIALKEVGTCPLHSEAPEVVVEGSGLATDVVIVNLRWQVCLVVWMTRQVTVMRVVIRQMRTWKPLILWMCLKLGSNTILYYNDVGTIVKP